MSKRENNASNIFRPSDSPLTEYEKEQIALRVDAEVLAWFRAQGSGWQTRMNEVLKAYWKAVA